MTPEELHKIIRGAIEQSSGIPWWIYVLALLLPFVGSFLGSYARKKGENVATKEDVEEITQRIESVKTSHTKEIEQFRSDVLKQKEREKQYYEKKEELLLGFYDQITTFYYEYLAVNLGDFPSDEGKSLYEYQTKFDRTVTEIMKSYQRVLIYIDSSSQLLTYADKIVNTVLSSRIIMKKHFGSIKSCLIRESAAHVSGDKQVFEEAVTATDTASKAFGDEMNPNLATFRDYYQKFLSELNEYVKPKNQNA